VNPILQNPLLIGLLALLLGFIIGYGVRKILGEMRIQSAEKEAQSIKGEAKKEADTIKREAKLAAKEEAHATKEKIEQESRERRLELQKLEQRLLQKEENLEKKSDQLERREEQFKVKEQKIQELEKENLQIKEKQLKKLEEISGFSKAEAQQELFHQVERDVEKDLARMIKEKETQAKEEAEKKAREVISLAIQRYAADHIAETTVSVVSLPNDEMKGRIIGREGRNIRTLENLTGIDLIIDDTPEAVILSGFDPIRREIARVALEKLIADGRIHPGRIEEMVEKSRREIEAKIREEGEQAAFDTGVHGIHKELIKLLGRLKYRTSYGQNVLNHSIEVAHLCGIMASEIGADVSIAKRAGLLHDIGKAVDHEVEGPHVEIGADLCKRYGESKAITHAVLAHHEDLEFESTEAVLVAAADALSAARPGARRETLESYVKRLESLEKIADSFEGVDKAYAIQAGREIRILVKPDRVRDDAAPKLARDIVKTIEEDLEYPGQIKVTIIRETRAVDYAK